MKNFILIFICYSVCILQSNAQVLINEVMPSNYYTFYDEDYEASDWVELYNPSNQEINLKDYGIYDKADYPKSFKLPDIKIGAKSYLTLFASDKNRSSSDVQIIENTSNGIWHGGVQDDGTFYYQMISGDFVAELDVRSIRQYDRQSMVGMMLRTGLERDDAYVGIFCKSPEHKGYITQYRKEKGVSTIYTQPDYGIDYPNENIRLERKGDSVYTYFLRSGAFRILHAVRYLPSSTPLYFGVAASSSNIYLNSIFAINSFSIDNTPIKINQLTKAEIGTSTSNLYDSKEIHTNFKIKTGGEVVYLWNKNGQQIDFIQIPQLLCDVSFGRYPDGSDNKYYFKPGTPSAVNKNQFTAIAKTPTITTTNQWNDNIINIKITNSEPNSKIYYSTDGTLPCDTTLLYNNEDIRIDKNKVVRAICIKDNYLNSPVETKTFFYQDSSTLPVMAISSDSLNFWDPEDGIFIQKNMYSKREIPATIEYFDRNKKRVYLAESGLKLHGNVTRVYAQKALRFYARRLYETDEFTYPLFGARSLPAYETFILRNAGNDWKDAYFRDAMMGVACENIQNFDVMEYQPCMGFINGEFWGLYNIRERLDEEYISIKYNVSEESINLIESNDGVISGSIKPFIDMQENIEKLDLTNSINYKYAQDNIDIDWFIDYSFANIYAFNYDWPWNNVKFWQSSQYDNKWRWVLYDLDFGLGWMGSVPWGNYLPTAFKPDTCRYGNIAFQLLQNDGFKIKFINRSCDLLNTDFNSERMVKITDSLAAQIRPEISRQHAKWSESVIDWENKVKTIRNWVDLRADSMPNNYVEYFKLKGKVKTTISINKSDAGIIKLNTIYLRNFPWTGIYMQEIPIELTVYPNSGFNFKYWIVDAVKYNENPLKLTLNNSVSDIQAVFGTGSSEKEVVINEIMYKSADDNECGDWIELYNPNANEADLSGYMLKDNNDDNSYVFPQNTKLAPDSYLVVCASSNSFSAEYPNLTSYIGNFSFGLGKEDAVRLYNADLRIVDSVAYTSAQPWYDVCYGIGPSLELKQWDSDNAFAFNWSPSYVTAGTPGAKNSTIIGVEDRLYSNDFKIYPNPTNGISYLEFISNGDYNFSLEIVDLIGNIYMSENYNLNSGSVKIPIDFSMLTSGAYFIKLKYNADLYKVLPLMKR